ncbi:MAG: metal-dependent hydrolase [Bacteroidota bacterium]
MDSLTQIVLGAACGEVVLGKKVGNRAILWGAVGGTIPDMDVLGNFMMTDMEALAFHRGISHSFFFAVTTPFLFGYLTHRLYQSGLYQRGWYKGIVTVLTLLFTAAAIFILNTAVKVIGGSYSIVSILLTLGVGIWLMYRFFSNYTNRPLGVVDATYKDWVLLFFWSIFTHPILDAFTAYGTQLFAPFSDYRVAWNTISVADPAYTVPFLSCLIGASFFAKTRNMRRYLNYLGLILSSSYLAFTVINKQRIDRVFAQSLEAEQIEYSRFRTGPSIFNNILWQGVAEAEDGYYYGSYSLLDKKPSVYRFYHTPKNHDLVAPYEQDKNIQILQWFTDGYYTVTPLEGDTMQIGDLRYGTTQERPAEPEDFVFKFTIVPQSDGTVEAFENRDFEDRSGVFSQLVERVKGY